jgi:hypothetical protein
MMYMETTESVIADAATAETNATDGTAKADANAELATGAESATAAAETGKSGKPPHSAELQDRFDKLTREKYEGLSRAERAEYRAQLAEQRLEALETQQKAKTEPVAPEQFPTLEQFGYDEGKFMAAVAAYSKGTTEAAKAAAREAAQEIVRAEREASRQNEAVKNWAKKEAEFIKSKPDYVEKVLEARTLPISREMQMELRESELGPQIAYYLVENSEKAAAIMALPLKEQLKEIGRIEARLESTKTPAKPAVSQAPPPVQKVDSNEAQVEKSPSDMSDTEFAKWRRRQIAQRRNS